MPTATNSKRPRKSKELSVPTLSEPALRMEVSLTPQEQDAMRAATAEMAPVVATPSKKKSKKPVHVVAVVTPNGIEGSFTPEPRRPLIAHLPIRSSEVNFQDTGTGTAAGASEPTPVEPEPFNPVAVDMFAENQEGFDGMVQPERPVEEPPNLYVTPSAQQEIAAPTVITETRPMQCFAKVKLMTQFETGSNTKALPTHPDVACFWCAHTFEGQPCIIPEREVAGVYNVYGNFCCPQCALAYLLQETMDPHVRWERIALLHRLYDREGKGRMSPAPGREVLKLFGGPLTIESYRATMTQGKVRVDTHMPPMVSILGSIDTKPIDFFDSSLKNTLIGSLQMEKTVKAEEGLRLKRTKPLKDRESTLDSVMNIQIRNAQKK